VYDWCNIKLKWSEDTALMRENSVHLIVELLKAYQIVVICVYFLNDLCPEFVIIFKGDLDELVHPLKDLF